MILTTFTIEGKVKPKERPRKGKWGNFYTPKKTQEFEVRVWRSARDAGLSTVSPDKKLGVKLKFWGMYGRSDIDNMAKTVLDGFKQYFNDNKVNLLIAEKLDSKEYKTEVTIWEL